MASNSDQSTMTPLLPLTDEQRAAIKSLNSYCHEQGEDPDNPLTDLAKEWLAKFGIGEDDMWPNMEKVDDFEVYYLFYEDGSLTPSVAAVFQEILCGLDAGEYPHLVWEGAYTCSKMRPGEFGGWACVITRDDIYWSSTQDWIDEITNGKRVEKQLDLNLDELQEQHGGYWGEHPKFPVEDWVAAVVNEDTRQGYWEWVEPRVIDMEDEGG